MRDNDASSDHHQIIHAHARPLLPAAGQITLSHAQFSTNLPTPVQEHPHEVSFLDPAYPAGDISPVVEHKWNIHLRSSDRLLHRQEFLSQPFSGLRISEQRRFRQGLRYDRHSCIDNLLLPHSSIGAAGFRIRPLAIPGRGYLSCIFAGSLFFITK